MQGIRTKIEAIEKNIRKLLRRNKELAENIEKLKEENLKLKKELQDKLLQADKVDKYTEEVSIFSQKERAELLREELGNYIEQVDDCIKILEGQN